MNTPSQPPGPYPIPDPNGVMPRPANAQPDPNAAPQQTSQPQPVNTANQPAIGAEKPITTKFNGDVYAWFLKEVCHVADLSEVGDYELMCGSDGDDDVTDARFTRVYRIHSQEYKAKTGNELLQAYASTPVARIFDAYVATHPIPPPQSVFQPAQQSAPSLVSSPAPAQADPGTQQMPASAAPVQDPATVPQAPADPGQATAAPALPPAPSQQASAPYVDPFAPAAPVAPVTPEQAFQSFVKAFSNACDPERFNSCSEQDLRDLHSEYRKTNSNVVRDVAHFVELKGFNLPPAAPDVPGKKLKIALLGGISVAALALAGVVLTTRDKIDNSTDHKPAPSVTAVAPKPVSTASAKPTDSVKPVVAPSPKPTATTEPSAIPVAPTAAPTATASAAPTAAPTATTEPAPTASSAPAPQPSASAPRQPEQGPLAAFTVLCTNRSIPENCRPADPNVIPYVNRCKFNGIQHLTRPLTISCTDAQGYPGPVYTTGYNIQDRAAYSGNPYGENVEFTVYLRKEK